MNSWALDLIGKPYVKAACGPDAFDCWGLLLFVYKKQLGIDLKGYPDIVLTDEAAISREITKAAESPLWQQTDKPFELCAVAMSRKEIFHHVGIYIENDGGLIVHARGKMVSAEPIKTLRSQGFKKISFFKHADDYRTP